MKLNKLPYNNLERHVPDAFTEEGLDIKTRMKRKNVYWITQLSGWVFFALINTVIVLAFDGFSWQKIILILYLCFTGISLTHIFRYVIKKKNWLTLPLKKIVPRVLVSCVIIGAVMFVLYFGVNLGAGIYHFSKFKVGTPLIGIFNLSSVTLLWALIYFSVHYFENYRKVQIESLIWEAAVKDFELKTLKSQLNPHFMFNALNSIRALIGEDPMSAQTAVTKLSNILRYSLKMERTETVPLEEEIRTVSDYLALESIRFEERLKFDINISPGSARVEIPPMMVQTLVENAIKHGVSKRTEGGSVSINTSVEDSTLQIFIKNTGRIDEKEMLNSGGFGVSNTKHRLSLLYGEAANFTIQNCSDNEVLAKIVIPTGGIRYESFNNR
jgi:sensor histidine kinase YesM